MLRATRALPLRAASCVRAVHQPTPLLRSSALAATMSSRTTVHRRAFHATTISANTTTTTATSTAPSTGSVDTQTLAKAETAAAAAPAAAPPADGAVPKPTLLERLKKYAEKNQIKWINCQCA